MCGHRSQQVPGEADRVGDLSTMINASTAEPAAGDLWNGLVVRLLTFCKNETDTKSVCNDKCSRVEVTVRSAAQNQFLGQFLPASTSILT